MKDYQNLIPILKKIEELSESQPMSIKKALAELDHFGFSLIALILVLPFMQPFPVGPLSVIGGLTIAALGVQLLKRKPFPTLPQKLLVITPSNKSWKWITKVCIFIIHWSKKITMPRLLWFVSNETGLKFEGGIFILGGLLIAIPFVMLLPLNNFFPGLAILFATIAQFEKDGLFIVLAIFWIVFSFLYFSLFMYGAYLLGAEGMQYLPEWALQFNQ
jgi:hypothetical protein